MNFSSYNGDITSDDQETREEHFPVEIALLEWPCCVEYGVGMSCIFFLLF